MDRPTDSTKMLAAYRIINQQLAKNMQKLKADLHLYEERYVMTSEMLLQTRQENKALRDMVRKLKDQIQMVTEVMVSVQQQSAKMFDMINQPHALAENVAQTRSPRAQQVFDRLRTENPPCVDEMTIQEEEEHEPISRENIGEENASSSFGMNEMVTQEEEEFVANPRENTDKENASASFGINEMTTQEEEAYVAKPRKNTDKENASSSFGMDEMTTQEEHLPNLKQNTVGPTSFRVNEISIRQEEEQLPNPKENIDEENMSTSFEVGADCRKNETGVNTSANTVLNDKSRATHTNNSPLIQRLKRRSKNTSFDESFETIDRERAFKMSRHNHERRRAYVNLSTSTDAVSTSAVDCSDQLSAAELNQVTCDKADMEMEKLDGPKIQMETMKSVENNSTAKTDLNEANNVRCPNTVAPCRISNLPLASPSLKKTACETTITTEDRTEQTNHKEGFAGNDSCIDEEHTMHFNPADFAASCSTPVAARNSEMNLSKGPRDRQRLVAVPSRKIKSELKLHIGMLRPVVVLQPLTMENVAMYEQGPKVKKPRGRPAGIQKKKQKFENDNNDDWTVGRTDLESCSSTENISVKSNEGVVLGRPRRRAAPTSLREISLSEKLRRP